MKEDYTDSGKKVRIIKCCPPFMNISLLGKVDNIKYKLDNGPIYLEKLKINVNPEWVEFVDDAANDIYLEYNEKTMILPTYIYIETVKLKT